jgi:hypothetical protein
MGGAGWERATTYLAWRSMAVAAHNAFGWGMPVVSVPVTPAVTPNPDV